MVVRLVWLEFRTKSVKEPGLAEAVGVLPKLQAPLFRLALDPLKTLIGRPTVMAKLIGVLVPAELDAEIETTVGPPRVVGWPLMIPVVESSERPSGKVPVTENEVAPGGSVTI